MAARLKKKNASRIMLRSLGGLPVGVVFTSGEYSVYVEPVWEGENLYFRTQWGVSAQSIDADVVMMTLVDAG